MEGSPGEGSPGEGNLVGDSLAGEDSLAGAGNLGEQVQPYSANKQKKSGVGQERQDGEEKEEGGDLQYCAIVLDATVTVFSFRCMMRGMANASDCVSFCAISRRDLPGICNSARTYTPVAGGHGGKRGSVTSLDNPKK